MSDTQTSNDRSVDDVLAIIQGMNRAPARDQTRAPVPSPLPTQLQPDYQPSMPVALRPQQVASLTLPPQSSSPVPQQSPAPWAVPVQPQPTTSSPSPSPLPERPAPAGQQHVALGTPFQVPLQTQPATPPPRTGERPPLNNMPVLWNSDARGPSGQTKQQFLFGRMMHESQGNPTILNYVARNDPRMYDRGYTAGGLLQDLNTTWKRGVEWALANPERYPMSADPRAFATAREAPWDVQWQVNSAIYDHAGEQPWRGPGSGLGGNAGYKAIADLTGVRDQLDERTPYQGLTPAQPRSFGEWGREPPGMGGEQPGEMPRQSDFGRIMSNLAPLLVGIGSLALRLPLSTAITAYGAMARAQQNGQELEYQHNRTRWQDHLKEATAQQTLESQAASDAFSEYGNNNPQGLQQRLAEIALQYNDPTMYRMAEQGDLNGIHQLQQRRDMANQNLVKLNRAQQDEREQQEVDADVAARDKKWAEENPNASEEDRAIAHAQHRGQAEQDIGGKGQGEQEGPVLNVMGADGKPTGQQVRTGRNGGYFDPNTRQPVQLQPGETVQQVPRQGTGQGGTSEGAQVYNVVGADEKPTGRQVRLGKNGGLYDTEGKPATLAEGEHLQPLARSSTSQGGKGMEGQLYDIIGADDKPTGKQARLGKQGGVFDAETGNPSELKDGEHLRPVAKAPTSSGTSTEGMTPYDVIGQDGRPTGQQVRMGKNGGLYDLNTPPNPVTLAEGQTVRPISRQAPPQPAATVPDSWNGAPYKAPPNVDAGLWQQAVNWAEQGRPPVGLGGRTSSMYQAVEPLVPAAMKALGIQSLSEQALRYDARRHSLNAIETGFGSGVLGRNLVSLNTVAEHIALFRQYADALRTGDIQRINQLKNRLATEAGSPEVIDFALAGRITGDEVVRLLTTTGGTLADREDIASRLAAYDSPDQFEGAANTLTNYVRGRYLPLRQQYSRGDPERERYFDNNMVTPEARHMFQGPQAPIPGQDDPAQTQPAPTPSPVPVQTTPQRPAAVPQGSQYSPSRKQWRDPTGKLYNEDGSPAGG